ncbi:unnamed protein product [Rhizoctonia solani]|uniref:UvrD-like helicase ATP-binding domain-containing protein n=1 Tax=Rhizoctonia solani TaxID=456999 RepID=A0A8H3B4C4_9AGAM|nr:unnamed protein product [Rhizoctonia solani]
MESEGAEELGEKPKDLDQALVEFDNEVDLRTDLPHRFSLLNESHFPLFISFDKLCSLIEADLHEEQKVGEREFWVTQQRRIVGFKYDSMVFIILDYAAKVLFSHREFKEVYWPRFKLGWASTLNPALVYSEVVGVIKGYSEALGCINGHLSLDQYLGRAAHKVSPHLDDSIKHQIYSIFKEYEKIKSLRSEWDHADRSHYILEKFKEKILHGALGEAYEIDYLYVDEVQDNLMTDIRMLRRLCGSIRNTYWGGDTAQTIVAGRLEFDDIILYNFFAESESAGAFVNAALHERAIRTLLDGNYFKRAVKMLFEQGDKLESRAKEEFLERCRRYYFEKTPIDIEALSPLFKDLEDQLSYARKYAYWEQLKQLLEHHNLFDDLAQLCLDQREPTKSLDWFLRAYDHHRKVSSLNEAANVAIRHAEWVLSLEGKSSPQALDQIDGMLEKAALNQKKIIPVLRKELNLYQTIRKGDFKSITTEGWNTTDPEESLRRTLILHTLVQGIDWFSSQTVGDVMVHLKEWNSYICDDIITKLLQASEPSKLVAIQRLFGFKPANAELYASPYYIVAEGSLIAESGSVHKYSFTTQRNSYNELLIPARWVDTIMKDDFRECLHDKLRKTYFGLIRSGWTSPVFFNPRVANPAKLSRTIRRAVTSDKGFKTRFNVINQAIEAFAPVCRIPFQGEPSLANPGIIQLWVRRIFDTIYPITGIFEEIPDSRARRGQPIYPGLRAFIQQCLTESSSSFTHISMLVITSSLSMQLGSPITKFDVFHSTCDAPLGSENEKRSIGSFFNWENTNGLTAAVLGLRNVLTPSRGPLDAVVMVHLVEMITCDFLYHIRAFNPRSYNGFSGLILPYSWARVLAKRYARSRVTRDTTSLDTLLEVVIKISDELKHSRNSYWWVAQEPFSNRRDIAHILQLRLCWCISLLFVNAQVVAPLGCGGTHIYSLLHVAGHVPEQGREPLYRRYSTIFI